jgi:NAD(P)-dependent dehydrogenase (short-subunit alcohol dehydrogenase family)
MNYVKSLSKQLGPKGIRVNGVAPGPIWTPLQVSGGATQEHLTCSSRQTMLAIPLGTSMERAAVGGSLNVESSTTCFCDAHVHAHVFINLKCGRGNLSGTAAHSS